MAFTFNGATKTVTLSAGTTALDVVDLYSRWKDWVSDGNAWADPAFDPVGGNSIDVTAGTSIPLYAFLVNGWRIRPQDANHTLSVTGGVLLVSGGGDPFLNTAGSFVVRINYSQPVQAITVATGGGGSTADVWNQEIESGLTAAQLLRLLAAVAQGNATGLESNNPKFMSVDGSIERVVATYNQGTRTVTTRNP